MRNNAKATCVAGCEAEYDRVWVWQGVGMAGGDRVYGRLYGRATRQGYTAGLHGRPVSAQHFASTKPSTPPV